MKMEKIFVYGKKGLSPVITTILLILLSVSCVAILAAAVIPFVRSSLDKGKECFSAAGLVRIDTESEFTCYYPESGNIIVNVTIARSENEAEISGIKISLFGGGLSKIFDIKDGQQAAGVKMLDGASVLELPGQGEERTYSFAVSLGQVDYVQITPIMKSGRICETIDKASLEEC